MFLDRQECWTWQTVAAERRSAAVAKPLSTIIKQLTTSSSQGQWEGRGQIANGANHLGWPIIGANHFDNAPGGPRGV